MDEALFRKAVSYITELFRQNAGGHDAAHSLRVYRSAMMIAEEEPDCDKEVAALAALLKDLMNTETGKELAQKRHAFLEEFLRELREETEEE